MDGDHDVGFGLFQNLPTELRLQIWRLACHPRVIDIIASSEFHSSREGARVNRFTRETLFINRTARAPSVLGINRESRSETIAEYRVVRLPGSRSGRDTATPWFLFDSKRDTLRLASWCHCHTKTEPPPEDWLTPGLRQSCAARNKMLWSLTDQYFSGLEADGRFVSRGPPGSLQPGWHVWWHNLVHLAFDASFFSRAVEDPVRDIRLLYEQLVEFMQSSPLFRTCTITMASAPSTSTAPRFPMPGDFQVTHTYNVRAVRIAVAPPLSERREPRLLEDGAVMVYHNARPSQPGHRDLAIFELMDEEQLAQFTRPVGGPTALARRMSWLLRTAPGPRAWLHVFRPIDRNAPFRTSFVSDMHALLTEWLLLEAHTRDRRLAAACHGICMPDYGF